MKDRIEKCLDWMTAKMQSTIGKEWDEMSRSERIVTDCMLAVIMLSGCAVISIIADYIAPLFE